MEMEPRDNGNWVRGRCLGKGSAGEVHLAIPAADGGRSFAVKSAETGKAATLRKECEILSSLRSPYVVSCLGSGASAEPDGRVLYNLFLEYVPGGSVADVIRRRGGGGLDERAIQGYARGILRALEYLHSLGVVHCDVKGQNVLVAAGDRVKLADFGCARRERKSAGTAVAGTPLFMAPEVARGEEQGPEADVWALGCTVVEMATGRAPWPDAEDPLAAVHRIAFSGDLPEFPKHLSVDARDFLGRCLIRDPRERWTAAELLAHPFVRCGVEGVDVELVQESELDSESPFEKRRSTPKSTLDQDQWASWASEEDDETEPPSSAVSLSDSAAERLGRLASISGVGSLPFGETWDESTWINVRASSSSQDFQIDRQVLAAGGGKPPGGRATVHLTCQLKDFQDCRADVCCCNGSSTVTSFDYQLKVQVRDYILDGSSKNTFIYSVSANRRRLRFRQTGGYFAYPKDKFGRYTERAVR